MSRKRQLCVCLLNVSEARNVEKVHAIAKAALSVNENTEGRLKSSVLNIFNDHDYNRSVITIAGHVNDIGSSIVSACKTAYDVIDLREHEGGHPRLGAVDLIPIHPVSEEVTLSQCGTVVTDIAQKLSDIVPGASFFLFGAADPRGRGLVRRRKKVGWFKGCHGSSYEGKVADVGAIPGPTRGLTGAGAIPYVTNCNVTIDTDILSLGRRIAASLRATSPGGLPGVQAMAFPHQGQVEIACNVEGLYLGEGSVPGADLCRSYGRCYHVPPGVVGARVRGMARGDGVDTVGTALVGFSPSEASNLAVRALEEGVGEYWRVRTKVTM